AFLVHNEVNMYHFNIDYQATTFDGMTAGGDFQNGKKTICKFALTWQGRPWNFALDAMWQTYGLVGASDAYYILKRNGYTLTPNDDTNYRNFIKRIASAVNSGFHAWTKWADYHPGNLIDLFFLVQKNHVSGSSSF